MTTLRQAAQQALEALEYYQHRRLEWDYSDEVAITALRAALAEPVQEPVQEHEDWCASVTQLLLCDPPRKAPCNCKKKVAEPVQEPVAWMIYTEGGTSAYVTDNPNDLVGAYRALALYTAPPQRKPLTDEEIDRVTDQQWAANNHKPIYAAHRAYARAIERAHGITGGSNG